MKNKLSDLKDHLFAQLERLGDESIKGDELETEIARGKAIAEVGRQVIDNASLVLEAHKLKASLGPSATIPTLLVGPENG